ncbi:hypothetical protein [Nonomuraea sp. KM90]|uniref:hypothetical protein n=1 Tax=Nonomuraea sp. KM90 TaxID=3457428 RepID=UPI003FCEB483
MQRQPVTGFGHLQPPQQAEEKPQESAVGVVDPPANASGEEMARQEGQRSSPPAPADPQPKTVQEAPSSESAEAAEPSPSPAASAAAAAVQDHEERQVQTPEPESGADAASTPTQADPVRQAGSTRTVLGQDRPVRRESPDESITGTVATRKRRSSAVGSSSGYFQPRPAELPAPIKEKLASLPPNYLSLYQSFSDAANPAVGSAGRNVRLNASLASRLIKQAVADKRRLTAGTRRPGLSPSHYIDAALRQARDQPLAVLVQMGQSFKVRTSHEELPKPNTYTLTSDVGAWIDDLKDELTLVVAYRGMLGHVLNACVEAFLDGLEDEAARSA